MSETITADATSTEPEQVETATAETGAAEETTEGETALGDPGKKALDAMKAERNAAKVEARTNAAELKKLRDELALKDKPAEEQALEAARAEATATAIKAANERILKADLRAAATGKLADPTDAHLYINLSDFDVNDDGESDSDALGDAIADLLNRKPHLAIPDARKFAGTADQGARGKESAPAQLTLHDLEKMSPAQINKARLAGLLKNVLS